MDFGFPVISFKHDALEYDAVTRQLIDCRRQAGGISISAQAVCAQRVDGDQDDVGALGGLRALLGARNA
mgnify:CR=1 FL=1